MSNNKSSKEKKSPDSTIVSSIIGGIVTITVTAITIYFANRPPTPSTPATPIVITATTAPTAIPTDTVPPGEATSTPAPATDTPVPTSTFTATPAPVAIGEDWKAGCISSLWVLFPIADTPAENGCLKPGVDKFYTTNGRLAFVYSDNVSGAEIHGLFAKLPNSGRLSLNMELGEVANGEILIGVFGAPDISSNGAMLVIPATNNLDRTKMFLKSMPGQKLFSQSSGPVESNSGIYDMFFTFDNGEVYVTLKSGQINLGTVPALSSERWLFIGYQVFIGGNRLRAEFFNLVIVQ